MIVSSIMVPHPPLIVPSVGKGSETKISNTVKSYNEACKFIKDSKPDTIIIISPHAPYYSDYFHILTENESSGDFGSFGASDVKFKLNYDKDFITELSKSYEDCGYLGEKKEKLDHGTMVPLYFLNKYFKDINYVVIGVTSMPLKKHYKLGMAIKEVSNKLNRRVSIVASGDLSHRLLESGPYGFNELGPIYDKRIMNTMKNANFNELFEYSNNLLEEAAECGHPSFTMMAGSLDKQNVEAKMLSYEGPFGVGYGICTFLPKEENIKRDFLDNYLIKEKEDINNKRINESEYVKLARETVELFVTKGKKLAMPNYVTKEMLNNKKAVFVTLHKYDNLRGCIGTIHPTCNSLAEEIIENAIKSCSEDYRFNRVTESELPYMAYSVDVLGEIEHISSKDELNVKKYGVIVTSGYKKGLLLPNIDSVKTADEQVDIAMKKGNISNNENITLERFEVNRYY